MLKVGYKDGSGKDTITLDEHAILRTHWGCSCCDYYDEKDTKMSEEVVKLLNGKEKELRKIFKEKLK